MALNLTFTPFNQVENKAKVKTSTEMSTKILRDLKKKYETLEKKHKKLQSEQRRLSNHLLTRKASSELINKLKIPVLAEPKLKKPLVRRPQSALSYQSCPSKAKIPSRTGPMQSFLNIETEPVNIDISQGIKPMRTESRPMDLYVDDTIEMPKAWFDEVKHRD